MLALHITQSHLKKTMCATLRQLLAEFSAFSHLDAQSAIGFWYFFSEFLVFLLTLSLLGRFLGLSAFCFLDLLSTPKPGVWRQYESYSSSSFWNIACIFNQFIF